MTGSADELIETRKQGVRKREKKDCLQISETAQRLLNRTVQEKNIADRMAALHKEKLKAVKRRVADGFYERPDIKEKLADRLAEEDFERELETAKNEEKTAEEKVAEISSEERKPQDDTDLLSPPDSQGI